MPVRSLRSHQQAAKVRRAKRRREELGAPPRGRPGLPLHERCSKANVTWLDLVDLPRGLIAEHKRELLRRRVPGELTPIDVMRLQLLALFNGLKPGAGAALQVPVRAEQKLLGAGESTVQASNARLIALGLIERFEQRREVEWVDALGRRHIEATVWSKTYITARGLERLRELGESRRKVVSVGPQRARVVLVGGLRAYLLKACGAVLRLLARRFAGAHEIETPPLRGTTQREEEPVEGTRGEGRAAVSPTAATGPPSRTSAEAPPDVRRRAASREWVQVEFERLKAHRALSAPQAWPDLYWNGDRPFRRWLERQFDALYRRELTTWFVRESTAAERWVQQRRDAEDAARLDELERREPSEAEKRRRYHSHAVLWRRGDWVPAPVLAIEELKKVQRAKRAAGELQPKSRRRKR